MKKIKNKTKGKQKDWEKQRDEMKMNCEIKIIIHNRTFLNVCKYITWHIYGDNDSYNDDILIESILMMLVCR